MFKKYPAPSIFVLVKSCNQGVTEIQIFKQYLYYASGIQTLAEVYERVGKCVISVSKKAQKD